MRRAEIIASTLSGVAALRLVIVGPPRTKKTSNRILRFGRFNKVVPSAPFVAWQDSAVIQLRNQYRAAPITAPVAVRAIFYRDANRGDLIGYMTALADVLERAKVIANDRQIESWDGTRMSKSELCPRVEVVLSLADVARVLRED